MKLYIETTIPNMLFAEDAPEKRRATTVFFEWMKICRDELYVSTLVESELALAPSRNGSGWRGRCGSCPCGFCR